jgi:hypothetical protein
MLVAEVLADDDPPAEGLDDALPDDGVAALVELPSGWLVPSECADEALDAELPLELPSSIFPAQASPLSRPESVHALSGEAHLP